jgi:hypothetical protein
LRLCHCQPVGSSRQRRRGVAYVLAEALSHFERERGGPFPCIRAGERWHARSTPGAGAVPNEESGVNVFGDQDAIAQRSSPELASNCATVKPLRRLPPRHRHQVQPDASVTIRLPIPTPVQRVSYIGAETDDLAAEALICSRDSDASCLRAIWRSMSCPRSRVPRVAPYRGRAG